MTRVLFVSNGHGEAAIADRIARELRELDSALDLDHLGLVGDGASAAMRDVGPRRAMPSGGLIAMGNVRNILRDLGSGLPALTYAQYRFLRGARGEYGAAVAVGDVFALLMALCAGVPTLFVGTAKSVSVAPYGPVEERVLRRARAIFVRDDATAARLRERGLAVEPAANVIVDLFATPGDAGADAAFDGFAPALVLFPGSRESAYDDARFQLAVVRDLALEEPSLGAVLSVSPGLDARRFAEGARLDGWQVEASAGTAMPFVLRDGERDVVRAWRGQLGTALAHATVVLGQAGTANEAAAAAGVPVVAFERGSDRKTAWYRKRQLGLLGGALAILPDDAAQARDGVHELLRDRERRERMASAGRERMGAAGGASRVARRIRDVAERS